MRLKNITTTILTALLLQGCNPNTKELEQKQAPLPKMPQVDIGAARNHFDKLESFTHEYVEEGNADVRGTWYKHGSSGGWYGPNNEWGFGWYYLRQYGKVLVGSFEPELHNRGRPNRNPKVGGYVSGDSISLGFVREDKSIDYYLSGRVKDDTIIYHDWDLDRGDRRILKRTDKKISIRKTPWQKKNKDRSKKDGR